MLIEVAITKSPNNINVIQPTQTFTEQGGSIGRGPANTWVLDDPNRYMSTKHAEIRYEGGKYYLVDTSTNGTFIISNGAMNPIGNGNRVLLSDGDQFSLSDYEFRVAFRQVEDGMIPLGDPFDAGPFVTNTGSSFPSEPYSNPEPVVPHDGLFGGAIGVNNFGLGNEELDPLKAFGEGSSLFGNPEPKPNIFLQGTEADNANPTHGVINWPNMIPDPNTSSGQIPPNWYDEPAVVTPPPPVQQPVRTDPDLQRRLQKAEQSCYHLEKENTKLLAHIAALKQQLINQQQQQQVRAPQRTPAREIGVQDRALIDALGLAKWNLNDQKVMEITHIVGELVRETMIGLTQVLGFRKKIKEEFRINVTTIKPVENNPLKFSANVEDAMENMFIKDNKAYQKPVEAVREGFSGIAEHQVAVLAGIQAAFRGMLERFDPNALESRFEKYRKAGLVKFNQKGKNWDAYREFHQDLVNNIDNSFQHLFGYAFVQAYEEQMQKLQMSRKAHTNGNNDLF